ncbi:MAG TPA: SDR family NAD(P)-dependent oxidoreductase [Candidatus Binataceae bacterium]
MRLKDKIALITGGGKGIGHAIALAYAAEEADLALCARTESDLKRVALEVEKLGRRCFYKTADVTSKSDAVAMVDASLGYFGHIDILVNNAGGGDVADHRTLLEMDDKCWFDNIDLNLHGTWYFTKALLPHMVERRYGRIVNIASVAGLQGVPRLGAYAAAKHGVIGLSRTLALECGEFGITCNVICPGPTRAGWTISDTGIGKIAERFGMNVDSYNERAVAAGAIKRMVEPEEVAEMAVFFASDLSGATTGQSVAVCGGFNMH